MALTEAARAAFRAELLTSYFIDLDKRVEAGETPAEMRMIAEGVVSREDTLLLLEAAVFGNPILSNDPRPR